jgi:hypothetical protein
MPDPISRLQLAQEEIDRVFGAGYAAAHPDVLVVTVQPRRAIGPRRGLPRRPRDRDSAFQCAAPVARNSTAIEKTPPTSLRLGGGCCEQGLSFICISNRHEPRFLVPPWTFHTALQRFLCIACVAQIPVAGS